MNLNVDIMVNDLFFQKLNNAQPLVYTGCDIITDRQSFDGLRVLPCRIATWTEHSSGILWVLLSCS